MTRSASSTAFRGVGVSNGRAAGPAVIVAPRTPPPTTALLPAEADAAAQARRVTEAAEQVSTALFTRAEALSGETRAVVETTAAMALDPALVRTAATLVEEQRLSPERAVWQAADSASVTLSGLGGYIAERAADVRDVRDRIIAVLTGAPTPGIPDLEVPSIVLAHDLAPVDTADLDPEMVLGIVTAEGGPTSHTAILARSLGIPAIVGARGVPGNAAPGQTVLLDARTGQVIIDATDSDIETFHAGSPTISVPPFDGQGRTSDGHRVRLYANISNETEAREAVRLKAEGVGLLRTEMLYLARATEPTVEDQEQTYQALLEHFPGQTVVVRTLDAGSDKPVPYLEHSLEPNPALGVRGIRTTRRDRGVLQRQLEAIARAARTSQAQVRVLVPMISTVEEVTETCELARAAGIEEVGVMIETPAAAVMSGVFLSDGDFASIGTNDLSQYVMAADRQVGELSDMTTAWQPAVLRMMASACQGAEQQARDIGVCGEAAADPAMAVVFTGLGVTSLSMTPAAIAAVAAVLARTDLATCRRLAGLALAASSAEDARAIVRSALPILDDIGL